MKKFAASFVFFLSMSLFGQSATAFEITENDVGEFLCDVGFCRNNAVVTNIKLNKFNLPNLAEKLAQSGKQILILSFHQETPNKEYMRDFSKCNLIISSPKSMIITACEISGKVRPGSSNRIHPLALGDDEVIYSQENGWMAKPLKN